MSEAIAAQVEKKGWHTLHMVDSSGERNGYSYSIGFEKSFRHPEIIVFGLQPATAQLVLADMATLLRKGQRFDPYVRLANLFGADLEVEFRPVRDDAFARYLPGAVSFYGAPFRAWVMLWPDKAGRLPGEAGCRVNTQDEAVLISAG